MRDSRQNLANVVGDGPNGNLGRNTLDLLERALFYSDTFPPMACYKVRLRHRGSQSSQGRQAN